jgi:hypothetical protein
MAGVTFAVHGRSTMKTNCRCNPRRTLEVLRLDTSTNFRKEAMPR